MNLRGVYNCTSVSRAGEGSEAAIQMDLTNILWPHDRVQVTVFGPHGAEQGTLYDVTITDHETPVMEPK